MSTARLQDRQRGWVNCELDAAGRSRCAADPARLGERHQHLVHGRRADLEVALEVGLRGGAPHHHRVGVNEGEVLPLLVGERLAGHGADRHG